MERLNARFRRDPWTVEWLPTGEIADAGVLVHVIDGRENPNEAWRPSVPSQPEQEESWTEFYLKQSASFVYAGQAAGASDRGIPLFGYGFGLIFRPGAVNRLFCGFGSDAGGHGICHPVSEFCKPGCSSTSTDKYCDPQTMREEPNNQAGTCDGLPWRMADFGTFLQKAAFNGFYNEIIIDSRWWDRHLPHSVEFMYYGTADASVAINTKAVHRHFLQKYKLTEDEFPLLQMDKNDWHAPFKLATKMGCTRHGSQGEADIRYGYQANGVYTSWHADAASRSSADAPAVAAASSGCGSTHLEDSSPPSVVPADEDWHTPGINRPAVIVGF